MTERLTCQNGCGRLSQTTVRVWGCDRAVCCPCGARIRAVQEGFAYWKDSGTPRATFVMVTP